MSPSLLTNRRIFIIAGLIAVFVLGTFLLNKLRVKEANTQESGSAQTIRGVVKTLLPSGKVIVVKKDNGEEIFLSLSEASSITDELGEDLFYSSVEPGMPISAAGIKGVQDNVVIPSLITVRLTYAYKGILSGRVLSLTNKYFTLRYKESDWEAPDEAVLRLQSFPGCKFTAAPPSFAIPGEWARSVTERKIGGNAFDDIRYTLKGKPTLRVISLLDAGLKYGVSHEPALTGPYEFSVEYQTSLTPEALVECAKKADEVVSSFNLRNASQNIVLVEPAFPIRAERGMPLVIRGAAHAYDDTIYVSLVSETGKKILNEAIQVENPDRLRFGIFEEKLFLAGISESKLVLRIFQYSPSDGSVADLIELPLSFTN